MIVLNSKTLASKNTTSLVVGEVRAEIVSAPSLELLSSLAKKYVEFSVTDIIPVSFEEALLSLRQNINNGDGLIVAFRMGEPVGALLYRRGSLDHFRIDALCQKHYYSELRGFIAWSIILATHRLLTKIGEEMGVEIVVAKCSHVDTDFVLGKILERDGWKRRGYLCIWRRNEKIQQ